MTEEEEHKLAHFATFCKSDAEAAEAMKELRKINDRYHFCCEMDGMAMISKDEWCNCFNHPQVLHPIFSRT